MEILPWIAISTSLFHAAIAFSIWAIFHLLIIGPIPITGFCLFLLFIPFTMLLLGCIYFISSLCVYVKDAGNALTFIITALMFLSPIFYSIHSMPVAAQHYLLLNPLTFFIEEARGCLLDGRMINWSGYLKFSLIGLGLALMGYRWFQKTRIGFADVL